MFSPIQTKRARGSAGNPLPSPFKGLSFIRGQVTLVAAGPGTGKSVLALTVALSGHVPTLYFSADSDGHVQQTRMVSIATGKTLEQADRMVRSNDLGEAEPRLREYPAWFCFDGSPSLAKIDLWMNGYFAQFEAYPELLVVDNVRNVVVGSGEEDRNDVMSYLHSLAHETGTAVIAAHHVLGAYNDGDQPIPMSGVKGQISDLPEQILTMHKVPFDVGPDLLRVSTVKNRTGRADPSGNLFTELSFDASRGIICDYDG